MPRWIVSSLFLRLPFPSLSVPPSLILSYYLTLFLTPCISPNLDFTPLFLSPDPYLIPFFPPDPSLHHSLLFRQPSSFASLSPDPLNGAHWLLFTSQSTMSPSWQGAYPVTFCICCLIYLLAARALTRIVLYSLAGLSSSGASLSSHLTV